MSPRAIRHSRWAQVALVIITAIAMAFAGSDTLGVVAGLGVLVLLPALLFVDDPRTARGLPVATVVVLTGYGLLLHDHGPDALGDAFAFVAMIGPIPAIALLAQTVCLAVARMLPGPPRPRGNDESGLG